jgi:hypothetical protein
MPAFFGFILGILVTIGAAYLYDASTGRAANGLTSSAVSGQAPMVNWDVVSSDFRSFKTSVENTASDFEKRISKHTS